jgi:transcriptional regulator with XRE-family HTH domain
MQTEPQTIRINLRAHRQAAGLTQTELAERAAVSQSYIVKIEAGRGNVTVGVLGRLADALGVPTEALLQAPESTAA